MVIVFTNTKGGVGKSTLASHLAVYLHDVGARVCLLDADSQRSAADWVGEAEPKLEVRTARSPESIAEHISELVSDYDYVIADAPGRIEDESRTLMLLADLAIVPVTPSVLDLRSVAQAVELLKFARTVNHGKPDAILVLNRMKKRDTISRELQEAVPGLGLHVCKTVIRDLQAFRSAAQQGTVVTRMGRFARQAALDVDSLFSEIFFSMQQEMANE